MFGTIAVGGGGNGCCVVDRIISGVYSSGYVV
jgi:hypothetical protein